MLEAFFEFLFYVFFEIIALSIIEILLKPVFRFLKLPIVDETFNILAKILGFVLIGLITWGFFQFYIS